MLIGEYGWGGSLSSADQEPPTRAYIQRLLSWSPRFILFWQMYDNEGRAYWLIDSNHVQTPCYFLHQRLINSARLSAARFKETNSRLPNDAEFSALLSPLLNQPLPAPVSLTVSNSNFVPLDATSARVNGSLVQGIYGDDLATVFVFWGRQDGGPVRGNWEQSANLGVNTSFNPATFSLVLTNLAPKTNYWFRFYATNATGEAWAPASTQITTDVLNPQDFGSRLKIAFPGYTRAEALLNIPLLVVLSTNRAGFSYRQFASRTGGDLRFTDATGSWAIPHEIEDWNTNGFSSVWVRVPQLSGSSDFIWAYWGNPAETNPPAYCTNGAVWSQNFELVWHLKETTFPFADSTRKHPALPGDAPVSTAAGFIGRGALFNGAFRLSECRFGQSRPAFHPFGVGQNRCHRQQHSNRLGQQRWQRGQWPRVLCQFLAIPRPEADFRNRQRDLWRLRRNRYQPRHLWPVASCGGGGGPRLRPGAALCGWGRPYPRGSHPNRFCQPNRPGLRALR